MNLFGFSFAAAGASKLGGWALYSNIATNMNRGFSSPGWPLIGRSLRWTPGCSYLEILFWKRNPFLTSLSKTEQRSELRRWEWTPSWVDRVDDWSSAKVSDVNASNERSKIDFERGQKVWLTWLFWLNQLLMHLACWWMLRSFGGSRRSCANH